MTKAPDSNSEPSAEALDRVEELVASAQGGDIDSLNELFQRYHQTMVEMARRKLGPRLRLKEDPDDLAQTTFREAARDFQGYRYQGEGSLLRWLIQILQNKIRDKAEFYSAGKRDLSRDEVSALSPPASPQRGGQPKYTPLTWQEVGRSLLLAALEPVASQLCAANATHTAASLNVQLTPSVVELHKPTIVSVDGCAVRPGDRVVLLREGDESSMELFVLDSSFTINVTLGISFCVVLMISQCPLRGTYMFKTPFNVLMCLGTFMRVKTLFLCLDIIFVIDKVVVGYCQK